MSPPWSRRALLANLGIGSLAAVAGCTTLGESSRGATDVILHNEATGVRSLDVSVTDQANTSTVVDTSITLEPNTRHKINNNVIMNGDYTVQITATGDAVDVTEFTETYEWKDAGRPLHAIVHDQIVFAIQVG